VVANSQILKNTLFPIDLMPVRDVFISQAVQVVGFSVMLAISFFMHRLGFCAFMIVPIWFLQIIFTIGVIWILSSMNVFLRDLGYAVSIFVLILMMLSPIAYTEEMIPPNLRLFLKFNPLYYLIMIYQKLILFNVIDTQKILVFAILSVSVFLLGYHVFSRLKTLFADQL
jgi:lipopolysaccharide transport system permease protein